jgi:ribosomal protein S18 acetylase RimI-like enzyme
VIARATADARILTPAAGGADKARLVGAHGIRALARGEDGLIAAILDAAFADDPVTRWTLGIGPRGRAGVFAALARALYLRAGFGRVTAGGEGGALWLPPGASRGVDSLTSFMISARILAAGGLGAISRAFAADAMVSEWTPEEPHYYLFAIAVRPDAQGQGWGRALMADTLARCDADGAPAYLECSKAENLPFYERFGFRERGRVDLPDGGPPLWLMRRLPQSPARSPA